MNSLPDNPALHRAADALRHARENRAPIDPIAVRFGIAGLEAAYAVAEINTAIRLAEGRRVVGKKVGLTSAAVQKQLGVDQPDFGVLFDDMEYLDGDVIPMSRLMQPKIEAEVAFIVGRDMPGEALTYGQCLAALAYALPALEIVDSAISNWRITLEDTVADNASCGLYVLGNQPVGIGQLALNETRMSMTRQGIGVSSGTGDACMGHPLRSVYWLACVMARRGQPLKAGDVILSGALGPMAPAASGDIFHAYMGALGSVSCRIE